MATVLERLNDLEKATAKLIGIVGGGPSTPAVKPDEAHPLTAVIIRVIKSDTDDLPAGSEVTSLLDGDTSVAVGILIGDSVVSTVMFPPKERGITWEVVGLYAEADTRDLEAHVSDLRTELMEGIKTAVRRAELLKECRQELSNRNSRYDLQKRIAEELNKDKA